MQTFNAQSLSGHGLVALCLILALGACESGATGSEAGTGDLSGSDALVDDDGGASLDGGTAPGDGAVLPPGDGATVGDATTPGDGGPIVDDATPPEDSGPVDPTDGGPVTDATFSDAGPVEDGGPDAVCGDGVCELPEDKMSCPQDCDTGTDPPPGDGSCAGKCGEYDGAASCQCDSACETYEDCCADFQELCTCDPLNPPTCLSDADCGACNTQGDLCAGSYACLDGVCAAGEPVVCDTSGDTECLATTCDAWTGDCVQNADSSVCDDGDYCSSDICDAETGGCTFEAIESCGENFACETSDAPTSDDDAINACVCDGVGAEGEGEFTGDSYCCNTSWDGLCVQEAQDHCGVNCNCEELAEEGSENLACETDEDCGWCNPENPCDGAWLCMAGTCAQQGKVVCDVEADTECMKNLCNPETLHCDMIEDLSACDDEDACTSDSCSEEGACVYEAGCGTTHPCDTSSFPQSNDEAINACVCEAVGASDGFMGDSFCCENAWDSICASEAEANCGVVCDCADPAFDSDCGDDSDCGFCSTDVCEANWSCVGGSCQDTGPMACDASGDDGCLESTCNSFTEVCEVVPVNGSCDDDDACTWDLCDGETGACANEAVEGCTGEPPFECLGGGEPSAMGCDAEESFEGCCDPWGRVLWCGENENGEAVTFCQDCAGDGFCGWSNNWYWCGVEEPGSGDPAGEAPIQCSGLTYAP